MLCYTRRAQMQWPLLLTLGYALVGCGPACLDDRCSLTPVGPTTMRTDYVNPRPAPAPAPAAPPAGSAAAAGSGSVAAGSGAGSAAPAPAPAPPKSATWVALGDRGKMWVVSTTELPASTKIAFELVRTPEKTPFVMTLETRVAGVGQAEAAWNDCAENTIRCDVTGTKHHVTKRAGSVAIAAGVNWALTDVNDQGASTLVTWTNNLSRELVSIRITR
jgi:hypothetical protein